VWASAVVGAQVVLQASLALLTTDGGGGALGEDGGGEKAATIIHQGELAATFGQVHEVYLASLSGERLGVASPDQPGLAKMEDAVDAAQAARDEASLCEVGVEAADAQAKLAVNLADDVQNAALQSIGAVPQAGISHVS
jgi:hypothetical protein